MSLGERIRNGASKVLAGSVSVQVINFAFGIALARLLMPSDFGMLATLSIFTGIAGFVSGAGMGAALVQAKEVTTHDFDTVFTLQLGIGLLIYAFFFAIAPAFASWYGTPLFADLLRVSALSFLLRPFINLPYAKLNREMHFGRVAVTSFIAMAIAGTSSVSLALAGHGVWALIWGGMAGSLANAIAVAFAAAWTPRLSLHSDVLGRLAGYGFKVSANDFINYVQNQVPTFVLSRLSGQHDVGIYSKGVGLSNSAGRSVAAALYAPLFRGASTIRFDRDRSLYLFGRALAAITVYALPLYIGTAWLAEPIVLLLYGEKWADAVPIVRLLAGCGLLSIVMLVTGAIIQAHDAVGREVIIQLQGLVLLAAGTFVGMRWGVVGVATALVGFWFFAAWRQMRLSLLCVGGDLSFVYRALKEPLLLNLALVAALGIGEFVRLSAFPGASDLTYALAMTGFGGGVYGLCFLFLPFETLATESNRWRRLARISRT